MSTINKGGIVLVPSPGKQIKPAPKKKCKCTDCKCAKKKTPKKRAARKKK